VSAHNGREIARPYPIEDDVAPCRAAGNTMVPGKAPILTRAQVFAHRAGLLNYIYQNDIANAHFCEAMLLRPRKCRAEPRTPTSRRFVRRRVR
jgi:hypothetical protein